MLRSHRHECESENNPYTGSKKHEFACISVAAVHIDTTCVGYSYEQFLCKSCLLSNPYEGNNTKFELF